MPGDAAFTLYLNLVNLGHGNYGIEAASRYLPVGALRVGGDWHDIIALPGGRAADLARP